MSWPNPRKRISTDAKGYIGLAVMAAVVAAAALVGTLLAIPPPPGG